MESRDEELKDSESSYTLTYYLRICYAQEAPLHRRNGTASKKNSITTVMY